MKCLIKPCNEKLILNLEDIENSIVHINRNLNSRYNVYVTLVTFSKSEFIIDIKGDLGDSSLGIRLKGISNYLFKKNSDYYNKFKIGSRLFDFIRLNDDNNIIQKDGEMNFEDIIYNIVKIYKNNSNDNKIKEIIKILNS